MIETNPEKTVQISRKINENEILIHTNLTYIIQMSIFGAKIQNKLLQNDLLLLFSYVFQHLKRDQFIMEKKLGWRELGGVG